MPTSEPRLDRIKRPVAVAATSRRETAEATLGLLFHLLAISIVMIGMLIAQAAAQDRASAVRQACSDDYRKLCSSVTPGGGRIKQCMTDHAGELSSACRTALLQESGAK
jgi:hypothetical protein